MSDTPPIDPKIDVPQEIIAAQARAKAVLEELNASKSTVDAAANSTITNISAEGEKAKAAKIAFDTLVQASTEVITAEVEKAKAAGAEATKLKNEVSASKTAIDSERSEFVTKTKASQIEIESIKTGVATIKGSIEATQKSASADLGIITQSKADVEQLKAAATALSGTLSKDHQNITARISALQEKENALQKIVQELTDTKANSEGNASAIKTYLDEVEKTKERFSTLNTASGERYDALVKQQEALQAKIAEILDAHTKIGEMRRKLLESSDDAKSVQDEISELQSQINSILKSASDNRDAALIALKAMQDANERDHQNLTAAATRRFDELHKSLEDKILALLPSAGAAGLAWTYYDAKARYAPTPFASRPGMSGPHQRAPWLNRYFGYNPASWGTTIFFYALFMIPLLVLVSGTYDLVYQIEHNKMPMPDFRIIALRFLIAVPLATISTFGFASLRQYRKLYEQYNHKQRVMELYLSFKRELESNGDDEQKKKLLTIMLDAVAEKAWRDNDADHDQKDGMISNLDQLTSLVAKAKAVFG